MAKQREEGEAAQESKGTVFSEDLKVDTRRAALGGGLAAVVALAGVWMVGEASGLEARRLLETALSNMRSFCGTLTIALSNMLALMLTLLSFSSSADVKLKWSHYQRIKQIAWIDAVVLTGAVLLYLLLNVPIGESDKAAEQPDTWFAALYYTTIALASLLGGALIALVLMLYNAVRDIIRAVGPEDVESSLTETEANDGAGQRR